MSIVHDEVKQLPFYLSRPQPCPYLSGQIEQKIFTRLTEKKEDDFFISSALNLNGFRRSQSMLYRPACPACMACVPVRIHVPRFAPQARLRRIARKNADLHTAILSPSEGVDLFSLFQRYQYARHTESDMSHMNLSDYEAMLKEGGENAMLLTLREKNEVKAVLLADILQNGTSAIYSFFDPTETKRSLGTELIMRLVAHTASLGLSHVYLGYWIKECRKMAYKGGFPALERLGPHGWEATI